jgi:hypothetical protein
VDSRCTAAAKLKAPTAPDGKAATTLARHLNSIGVVHRLAGLLDPTNDPLGMPATRVLKGGQRSNS